MAEASLNEAASKARAPAKAIPEWDVVLGETSANCRTVANTVYNEEIRTSRARPKNVVEQVKQPLQKALMKKLCTTNIPLPKFWVRNPKPAGMVLPDTCQLFTAGSFSEASDQCIRQVSILLIYA